jgi:hypothetical protein
VLYVAEFYLPRDADVTDVASRARTGASLLSGSGVEVRFVQAIFVPQDESCFALYWADSDLEVTAAGQEAGLTFDRVVSALYAAPGQPAANPRL